MTKASARQIAGTKKTFRLVKSYTHTCHQDCTYWYHETCIGDIKCLEYNDMVRLGVYNMMSLVVYDMTSLGGLAVGENIKP